MKKYCVLFILIFMFGCGVAKEPRRKREEKMKYKARTACLPCQLDEVNLDLQSAICKCYPRDYKVIDLKQKVEESAIPKDEFSYDE